MRKFDYEGPKYPYPQIQSHTSETGSRVYFTPDGDAASVTTILSTLPHPELDAWRERVGDEEADRISKEATTIGTLMHDMLEAYVRKIEFEPPDPLTGYEDIAAQMFHAVKLMGLNGIDEIWGVEEALHLGNLYAGRSDLIGVYKRKASIIDYKTTVFSKKPEYLENYKLQLAAYRTAHDFMFQDHPEYVPIVQGVLLIGMRPNPKYKKSAQVQKVIIQQDEMDHYQDMWLNIVADFHNL